MEGVGGKGRPGFGTMQETGDDQHVYQLHPGAEGEGGVGELSPGAEDTQLSKPRTMQGLGLHRDRGVGQQGAEIHITADHRDGVSMGDQSKTRRRFRGVEGQEGGADG
eukprot:790796-Prorocentrum_lima.AAC.1